MHILSLKVNANLCKFQVLCNQFRRKITSGFLNYEYNNKNNNKNVSRVSIRKSEGNDSL